MPEIELRPCRPGDIDAVLAFWVRAGAAPRPTDHRDALEMRLKQDTELFILAWDGDRALRQRLAGGEP